MTEHLASLVGKVSVVARVVEGFIGNRIYSAYRFQCEFMLEEGAYPDEVDAALVAFGFAMGPFAVSDMSGLDIAWATRKRLAAADSDARLPEVLNRLCEAGAFDYRADTALPVCGVAELSLCSFDAPRRLSFRAALAGKRDYRKTDWS